MKKIDFNKLIYDNDYNYTERKELLGMEFIKLSNGNYMIKNSNNHIVSEKEKLQIENNELVIEDIKSECAKDITKKISKNKKRIEEIDNENIKETKPIKD